MQKKTYRRLREEDRHIIYRMRKAGNSQAQIAAALGGCGYFCQPYHSWEKGGVENFNGLVRQYLPKGTNFLNVSEASLADIETKLNQRPRKKLKFQTPENLITKLVA